MSKHDRSGYNIIPVESPSSPVRQGGQLALPQHRWQAEPGDHIVEAEWVQPYRPRRLGQWRRWLVLTLKIGLALAITFLLYQIPVGALPPPFGNWKNPLVVLVLVCYSGKVLLDTFFYDHYQP